jgi:hypothetical protein
MENDQGRSASVRDSFRTQALPKDRTRFEDGLTEDERYAVADHAVAQLKERGDPWRLNEEAPAAKPPST